eukprot:2116926-Pyramimonas_sp.AAC.1
MTAPGQQKPCSSAGQDLGQPRDALQPAELRRFGLRAHGVGADPQPPDIDANLPRVLVLLRLVCHDSGEALEPNGFFLPKIT